jgi:diguanylate cyclase (GGDEF)-like protein/PAS domain S-box-containing protein
MSASLAPDEPTRLATLRRLQLLDTPAEPTYDRLSNLASTMVGAPVGLITLLDRDRQWFKSACGTELTGTDRESAFCNYTIQRDAVLVVEDARVDDRFCDNPLVTGEPGIRAYCGAPVQTSDGTPLGSLCVLDFEPHHFTERDQYCIKQLAETASQLVQMREQAQELARTQHRLRASDRFTRATLDALSAHIAIIDETGTIEAVNQAWREFGRHNAGCDYDPIGANYLAVCDAATGPCSEEAGEVAAGIRDVLAGRRQLFYQEYPCHSPTEHRWFSVTVTPFADASPARVVVAHENITDRKLAEEKVKDNEYRYALTIQGSQNAIFDWDLTSDHIYYSHSWCELLGCDASVMSNAPSQWLDRVDEAYRDKLESALQQHIEHRTEALDLELKMHHDAGDVVWVLCRAVAVRDSAGRAVRLAGSLADITELKQTQEQLQWLASHDAMTGLANRALFTQRVQQAIERRDREPDYQFAILTLDFDRFKLVNDTLGHEVGDALLKSIAQRMTALLSEQDVAARFGGDEFAIFVDAIDGPEMAQDLAQRLLDAFEQPHQLENNRLISTASIGVINSDLGHDSAQTLLRDADAAMYQAKSEGKGTYRFFDRDLQAEAVARIALERQLWAGEYDAQFALRYQPILSLQDGQPKMFEAMLRWHHPAYGEVAPDRFIQIAEESGSIVPLGRWVLQRACEQLARWRSTHDRAGCTGMAVNISKRELVAPGFEQHLAQVLETAALPAEALTLEVTESSVMDDREAVINRLHRLRAMGVNLALDDFGTGHSSLSCLHHFPIDILKIDRSFVWQMEDSHAFSAVIHAVVSLAHTLNLSVVAEGIENDAQLVQLQAMEAAYGQGFYFARPVPADEAVRQFEASPGLGAHVELHQPAPHVGEPFDAT